MLYSWPNDGLESPWWTFQNISFFFSFRSKLNALLACFIASLECLYSAHISCEEWQDQSLLPTNRVNTGVGQSDLAVFFIYAPTTDLEQDRFQAKIAFTQRQSLLRTIKWWGPKIQTKRSWWIFFFECLKLGTSCSIWTHSLPNTPTHSLTNQKLQLIHTRLLRI